jgi:hypothetical protein
MAKLGLQRLFHRRQGALADRCPTVVFKGSFLPQQSEAGHRPASSVPICVICGKNQNLQQNETVPFSSLPLPLKST